MKLETMRSVLEALLRGDTIQDEDKYFFKFEGDRFYGRETRHHGWEPCDLSLLDMPATMYAEPTSHKMEFELDIYKNADGQLTSHRSTTIVCNSFGKRIARLPVTLEFEEGEGL